jgi:hypothetical protein
VGCKRSKLCDLWKMVWNARAGSGCSTWNMNLNS